MKKAFSLFLCFACLAFLVLSPAFIVGGVHKNTYTIREQKQREQYRGSLTLWHIVSFKTGGTSGVSFLRSQIRSFEKQHPYVFIDLVPLTPEEAEKKLAAGERPDLCSFPLGFMGNAADFSRLPAAESLLPAYADCGSQDNDCYAYPYMADFYTLACNQDLFAAQDVPTPLDSGISYENFIAALSRLSFTVDDQQILPLSLTVTSGLHPKAALLWLKTAASGEDWLESDLPLDTPLGAFPIAEDGGREMFLSGKSAMHLCPAAEYEQFFSDQRANSLSLSNYSISSYSDMVQMIGLMATEDSAKYAAGLDFAQQLLSEKAQKAVEGMKMLPVTSQEGVYEGQTLYLEEYAALGANGNIPNNFLLAANQKEADAALDTALAGDKNFKEKSRNLLFGRVE